MKHFSLIALSAFSILSATPLLARANLSQEEVRADALEAEQQQQQQQELNTQEDPRIGQNAWGHPGWGGGHPGGGWHNPGWGGGHPGGGWRPPYNPPVYYPPHPYYPPRPYYPPNSPTIFTCWATNENNYPFPAATGYDRALAFDQAAAVCYQQGSRQCFVRCSPY